MSTEEQSAVTAQTDDDEISLLDLALVFAENLKLLILAPLAAGFLALGIAFLIPPTYTATARILPPGQQQSSAAALAAQLGALAGIVGGTTGLKSPSDQYVAILKSRTVYDAIIQRFNLKDLYEQRYLEDTRKALAANTTISAGLKDGIISIDVDDRDPRRAADMANAFVEELRKLTNSLAVTEAGQRRLFFETQLKQAKDNLTRAEIALRGSGISEATLRTIPQATLESIARIKAQISAQEIKLASMRTYMTDSSPDLRVALQEFAALRTELSKIEQNNTTKATGEGAEYIAKFRDFKYNETLFELMAKQYEFARLDEAREGALVQVLDAAQPPERKSKPMKASIAVLTTVVFLIIMVLWVFIRKGLHNAANQPESAEKLQNLRRLIRFGRA